MKTETAPSSNPSSPVNGTLTQSRRISKCVLVATIAIVIGVVCGFC